MGQAHVREFFAQTDSELALGPTEMTDGETEVGEAFEAIEPSHAEITALVTFSTSTGAAGDVYNVKIELETDSDEAFADPDALKEYEGSIEVDEDGNHQAVVALPANLLKAKKYCRPSFTFTAEGGNSGTAADIHLSALSKLGGLVDQVPVEDYDRDGYEKVDINV